MSGANEGQLDALVRRVDELEKLVHRILSRSYKCVGCGTTPPSDWYWYSATNSKTNKTIQPLCANCVRNSASPFCGEHWKHAGPYKQPVPPNVDLRQDADNAAQNVK